MSTSKLKKSLGQHLLTNGNILDKIIRTSGISGKDFVLEIGAGTGLLTEKLAKASKKLIAIELDRAFEPHLASLEKNYSNLNVLFEDFLKLNLAGTLGVSKNKWTVIANPPYNIASQIIIKLLNHKKYFNCLFLTLQKEVAERICASPGSPQYGILTLVVGINASAKHLFDISPGSFTPPPRVNSSFIKITPLKKRPYDNNIDEIKLLKIIRASFNQRRKKIINSLKSINPSKEKLLPAFLNAGIDPSRRGETLSLEEFARLTEFLHGQKEPWQV